MSEIPTTAPVPEPEPVKHIVEVPIPAKSVASITDNNTGETIHLNHIPRTGQIPVTSPQLIEHIVETIAKNPLASVEEIQDKALEDVKDVLDGMPDVPIDPEPKEPVNQTNDAPELPSYDQPTGKSILRRYCEAFCAVELPELDVDDYSDDALADLVAGTKRKRFISLEKWKRIRGF